ncbi:thyroid receptor-interacting protein 11 isoform X1 [Paramormyrops kingsleyae]|uniref:Thyroid hormone receptor interactor 11 n=1 Tax=Paramormyrops kingsleyae TaxID=1676925 RepID=A0A3B3REC0_9TELE|nr:thyroid receptor-interacting protein 11 isoform X1 [Paramormyrops kingsleyae]
MSSWLGGLGSGLGQSLGQVGGNLSSFTEQISNFTKDILLEGAEEVGDTATELKVSNSRLTDLEVAYATQKSEYERLKKIHAELEEKHEASEIQIKQQSMEYRNLLQQKEVEINHLKARQSGLQEEMQKLRQSAKSSFEPAVLPVSTASSFLPDAAGPHRAFQGDEMDIGDVIWSQQEINRLSSEVSRLKAEVSHWKELVQASKPPGTSSSNIDQGDIVKLQKTIKELRETMGREMDEHQHELAAMQDAHRQKMAEITRRHREELAEYEERIEELEQIQSGAPGSSQESSKVAELQTKIAILQDGAAHQGKKLQELSDSLVEARGMQTLLQREKDEAQAENGQLMQNYARLQSSVEELQTRVQEQEGKTLHKAQLENEIQMLKKALAGAEKEISRLKCLNENEPEVEHADILELNTIIETLTREKAEVEKERMDLLQKLKNMEEITERGRDQIPDVSPGMVAELRSELEESQRALKAALLDRDTISAEVEELDHQNQEATQHLISLKNQLSELHKEADASVSRLQLELETMREREQMLQKELYNQKEKLSQSAFALNDMHMRRQQLEGTVKELQEKLGQAQQRSVDTHSELSVLKKQLQVREQELSTVKLELAQTGNTASEVEGHKEELDAAQKEVDDLKRELQEVRRSHEAALSKDYEIRMENQKLKAEAKEVAMRLEDLSKEIQDGKTTLNRVVLEKDTCINALKLEKDELESELSQVEKKIVEQAHHYQRTIEELTSAQSMDASALQTEHERAVKLNREKDFEIAELKRKIEQMSADHRETNEMLSTTVSGQKQLTELLKEKDIFVETLKAKVTQVQMELDRNLQTAKGGDALRRMLEEKEKHLGVMKEENSHLKEEIDRLRDQQSRPHALAEPKTLDIITELETEITQLKVTRDGLEVELSSLRKTAEEQRVSLLHSQQSLQAQQNELEQARLRHEQSLLNYEKLIQAKDEEITRMQEVVDQISAQRVNVETPSSQDLPPAMVILQEDKTQSLNGENGNEKQDLSKVEIEKLVRGIKEKETEISLLNEKNLSLAKQLDQLVVSQDEVGKLSQMVLQKDLEIQALHARVSAVGYSQDMLLLQQQLQAYAVEREQVLAVLNEKTRENSQLRSEYHRLMDIVAGKEAMLLKLQQENQRLSIASDPTGSQEMFRETIQNLSRIIREKDIEIDALTQKCQTLVTVLQTSGGDSSGGAGGGVSSNQFEELLQERDTLKQQVKKMEEWKQQVITTVKNMQHESAQLQEELIKLQGQISADSDCSSKLSVDYARLIQSYEMKERKLGSLSQELAQVQQTISQLSSTKDVLLGKLDSVVPESLSLVDEPVTTVEVVPPSHLSSEHERRLNHLKQDLDHLQRLLAEKDATIRTLQENNQSLSLASTYEQKVQVNEMHQLRDKLESLQKSLKEKDLLIKAKGDQLSQVSDTLRNRENDNEVLKQAVTNLKERTLILELDMRKLKEENEQIAARSREKETEFRALQETNMQVSLLLKEKEFESSTMREKAAAMEKMLKEGEQGKSGELNQLLNEVKSMQEKAVAFQQERDRVILALKQKQMETSALQNELQHMRDKEQRLKLELERLRSHLLEIEDSYTREAVAAEYRESELRRKVAQLDERLMTSSNAVESASQQASLQVESLQEQLTEAMRQRDEALAQLHISQEQLNQYAVSLSNLQMVLEQFQQEEKALYSAELEKHKKEKAELRRKVEMLEDQAAALQVNLDEATSALDSATRLTDQLDHKEEQIEELRKQVTVRQEMLEESQNKLMNLLNSTEGKVDKLLMRNLFVGYFHTPRNKRSEVLRLMGNVLELDRDDVDQLLEEEGRRGVTRWVSGWLGGRSAQSVPNTPQRPGHAQVLNTSFSEMFLKFLEVESSPALPAPKLPVYDITPLSVSPTASSASAALSANSGSGSSKRAGEGNSFLAPRSAAVPLLKPGGPALGGGGHLLMKPISDALPTFTPVPVSAEASAGSVLKDLLKQ